MEINLTNHKICKNQKYMSVQWIYTPFILLISHLYAIHICIDKLSFLCTHCVAHNPMEHHRLTCYDALVSNLWTFDDRQHIYPCCLAPIFIVWMTLLNKCHLLYLGVKLHLTYNTSAIKQTKQLAFKKAISIIVS